MKVTTGEADRFVSKPPKGLLAALVFGPDEGLVRERAEKLARSVVEDLKDPFRVAELSGDILEKDPARLAAEAAAISMLGGRRVVRVRGAGNGIAEIFERFLDGPVGDALVVVESGDLPKNSTLRRLFEQAENAAAVACYPDSEAGIADLVRATLRADNIAISADALDFAVAHLGSDRGTTRREIEKLSLYAGPQKNIGLEDVRAVLGDESEARTEEVCDALGEGDLKRLDSALEKLWSAGVSPAGVLRAAMSHFQRVLQVKLAAGRGESVEAAMNRGWPQIHFSRTASFKAQVSRWPEERILDALDQLLDAEALSRTTAVPVEAAIGRALFNIAATARVR